MNILSDYIVSQGSAAAGRDVAASPFVELIPSSLALPQGAVSPLPSCRDILSRTRRAAERQLAGDRPQQDPEGLQSDGCQAMVGRELHKGFRIPVPPAAS